MFIRATLLAAALATAGLAQAQAPSTPGKKELVARILQIQQPGIEGMARNLTEQPAMQVMQQAGQVLPRLPAERREAVARDIEADVRKYVEEATPIVRDRAVKIAPGTYGALLEERFSEEELRQVVSILESPVNKKLQALFPEIQRAMGEKLIAETKGEVEAKLRALQQSVATRLGIAPAAGASAPKAAAPVKK